MGNAEQKQKEEKKTSRKAQRKHRKKYHTSREKLEMDFREKKIEICSL